ncbi:hypothetical protein STANM309S_00845 [Streptomyces tanashiensis]
MRRPALLGRQAGPGGVGVDLGAQPAAAGDGDRGARQERGRAVRADGVGEDPSGSGRGRAAAGAVEQRPDRVVAPDEQPGGRRDVGGAGRLLLGGRQPGRRAGGADRVGPVVGGEVVDGRGLRLPGCPLAVEEVVVGADHVGRAVQGRAPADATGAVDVDLALEVGHVAVAARQDRRGGNVGGRVLAEHRGPDQDVAADLPPHGTPVAVLGGGRRVQAVGRGPVDALSSPGVADEEDPREVGGRGLPYGRRGGGPVRGPVRPAGEVQPDQGGAGLGAAVLGLPVLAVDAVRGDGQRHVPLGGQQTLGAEVSLLAGYRPGARGARPGEPDVLRSRGVAGVVAAVQEEGHRPLPGRSGRADDRGAHLDGLREAGQAYGVQGVLAADGPVAARHPGVDRVRGKRGLRCGGGGGGTLARGAGAARRVEPPSAGRHPQLRALGQPCVAEGQGEGAPVRPGERAAEEPVAGVELDAGVTRGYALGRRPDQLPARTAPGDLPALGEGELPEVALGGCRRRRTGLR